MSTRKLVGTIEEQALLEELIETVKPPDPTAGPLHYLLATPFRYPPLRHGSRFGDRHERGIWYGSDTLETALAEVAYYRLLFLDGTAADLDGVTTRLTAFRAKVRTESGVDLTEGCFAGHHHEVASPVSYEATQPLGRAMRVAGVSAFRYPSARDPAPGINVGVFDPAVFGRRAPFAFQDWHCTATRSRVELVERGLSRMSRTFAPPSVAYDRGAFLVDGRLPAPGVPEGGGGERRARVDRLP